MFKTGPGLILLIIVIVNFIISVFYLGVNLIILSRNKEAVSGKSCWTQFVIMLLCPIVGFVFFGLSFVLYRLVFPDEVDLEDVIFSKEKVKFNVRADEEGERNMIPLEEAVEITNKQDLRRVMMSVVSGDIQKFLAAISLALDSEDSETSHYAASVLQDELNNFRVTVEKQYRKIHEEEDNRELYAEMLIEYMIPILSQKVFHEMEQTDYVKKLDEVCEILYGMDRSRVTSEYMDKVAGLLLERDSFIRCELWCDRSMEAYPYTLTSYTSKLKLFFNQGKRDEFFELLNELKQTSIVIDKETLEIIRVFSEGNGAV